MKTRTAIMLLVAMTFGSLWSASAGAVASSSSIVPSPNSSPTRDNSLESVDCVSETFCFAVGSFNDGSAERTLVLEWNGTVWNAIPSPNDSPNQNVLSSVSCVSESSCVAVGFSSGVAPQALAMAWNDSSWTIVPSPTSPSSASVLSSVSCLSASFCMAVGSLGQVPFQTLVMVWDGSTWTQISSPNTSPTLSNALRGVSCTSASHCTAVGFHNDGTSYLTLAVTWNGSTWATTATPNPWRGSYPSQNNGLASVVCTSETSCIAVGSYGYLSAGRSLVLMWDGSQWQQVESPEPTGYRSPLRSVSCVAAAACASVGGFKEYGAPLSETLVAWSGPAWQQERTPNAGTDLNELSGVSCLSATHCIAVGYFRNGSAKQTLIMDLVRPEPATKPVFTG